MSGIEDRVFGSVDRVRASFQDSSGGEEGYRYAAATNLSNSLHRPQDLTPSPRISLEPPVCV